MTKTPRCLLIFGAVIVKQISIERNIKMEVDLTMKKTIILVFALVLSFVPCACATQTTTIVEANSYSLPDEFKSINELSNAVKSNAGIENSNLENLDYIFVLNKTPIDLPVSKIIITQGSAGVYYMVDKIDENLSKKYQDDSEIVQILSTIRVITYRNVIADGDKPGIVAENLDSFKSYEIDGRNYYAADVLATDGTLIGWEIFWSQDNLELCVGVPVSFGIDQALQYCNCTTYNFK